MLASSENGMILKMVLVFSIEPVLFWYWNPGAGEVYSGRDDPCKEKDNVDLADGQ